MLDVVCREGGEPWVVHLDADETTESGLRPVWASGRGSRTVSSWRDQAECQGTDPELFFPVGTTGPPIEQADRAKAVCRLCPVKAQCLAFATNCRNRITRAPCSPHSVATGGSGVRRRVDSPG